MIVIMTMIVSVGLLREIDAASESIDAAIVRLQWTLSLSFSSRRCDVTLRVTRNHLGSFVFKSTILCLVAGLVISQCILCCVVAVLLEV